MEVELSPWRILLHMESREISNTFDFTLQVSEGRGRNEKMFFIEDFYGSLKK